MQSVFERIVSVLNRHKTAYTLTIHEPVTTSKEAAAVRGVSIETGVKALLAKHSSGYALFVLPASKKLDWRKVKKITCNNNIALAAPDEVFKITHVEIGGIPPFGNLMGITTYFDQSVTIIPKVNFNAGLRTHSVRMTSKDLVKLVQPIICNITQEQ